MRADAATTAEDLGDGLRPDVRSAVGNTGAPELRPGAREGPLDLLAGLARARRVDLARLPILDLAERFGAALAAAVGGRRVPLNRAGDWLVVAAHLAAPPRSRLLPPVGSKEGEGRDAEAPRRRPADRGHARRPADRLERRPRLGRDVLARGAAEEPAGADRAVPAADAAAPLRACLAAPEKADAPGPHRPEPLPLWRVPDALARLRRLLPGAPDGAAIERFLPSLEDENGTGAALKRRSALASTLLAGLELEREGSATLAQDGPFGPVRVVPTARADA